jgi:O-antigen ligase
MLKSQEPQDPILLGLTLCCAFWAPWGPAISLPLIPLSASRVFVLFTVLLIGYWLVLTRYKFRSFPKSYNLLILLIVVHTCVTYGLLYPEELRFGTDANSGIDETTTVILQERGRHIARYFLNVLLAYALASAIRTKRQLVLAASTLGIGFCTMMVSGSRASISYSEGFYRNTGGFLNPNDLGQTAMVVVFLSLLVFLVKETGPITRGFGAISLVAGLYGLVSSASRSSMGALCIGFAVIMWYSSFTKRFRLIVVAGMMGTCIALFLSVDTWDTLAGRVSVQTVVDTRGSMRADIYRDYLTQFPQYALTGVGLKRAVEVTKYTYTTNIPKIPHNTYIETLVEFGCLGLLLFLLSLIQFWRRLPAPRRCASPPAMAHALMLGFLLAWAGLFLVASSGSRIFWFSWAIIAAYSHLNSQDEPAKTR